MYYAPGPEHDEVEDLYELLKEVKEKYPDIQAVASGAIFSNYQRLRVENICQRLGLFSLAYLWNKEQGPLLDQMIKSNINAEIVKICAMGLKQAHLGKTISELRDYFNSLKHFNICGEGGEYESAVFDCPLFKTHKIQAQNKNTVIHDDNDISPVAFIQYQDMVLVEKTPEEIQSDKQVMDLLIDEYSVVHKNHLEVQEDAEKAADIKKVSCEAIDQASMIEDKMTLSVSILKPEMSEQEVAGMD